ncbi:MAG: CRISPR-associated protein Cas5 [Sarcina sp.]
MAKKVLRLDLKQQQAHYRNPKFNQNDFIPSLKLPGKTTIMGN